MNHPKTAGVGWNSDTIIFEPAGSGIAFAVFARNNGSEEAIGMRWVGVEHYFGRESEWILIPHEFAADIAHQLAAKKAAGMPCINDLGFQKMIRMMKRTESIITGIGY